MTHQMIEEWLTLDSLHISELVATASDTAPKTYHKVYLHVKGTLNLHPVKPVSTITYSGRCEHITDY